ncbi:MAG TPA: hypothetical protein VMS18_00265 [Candidatus Binatia bacterium]|nr:hypothetical protein [Candidatus Binatia bacterium]
MVQFGVLNNQKRAIIALIHSIVFLGVAAHGFASHKLGVVHGNVVPGEFVLIGIYVIVSSILLWLVGISRGLLERAYFGLCATSATSGLVRTILGDRVVPPAQYLRVLMLSSAVAIGFMIVRCHSRTAVAADPAELSTETSPD